MNAMVIAVHALHCSNHKFALRTHGTSAVNRAAELAAMRLLQVKADMNMMMASGLTPHFLGTS